MKKVNFLIAGVQKGGTTALYEYLKQNPEIFMPSQKELHFFDNEKLDWFQPKYEDYISYFDDANDEQILGEATPIYSFWPHALGRIAAYNKNMRIILCLRNPTQRAYSHWRMEQSRNKDSMSFSDAIRTGRKRLKDERSRRIYSYVERGFYSSQLNHALELFGAGNLHILKQENLLTQHDLELNNISMFLNVSHTPAQHKFVRPVINKDNICPLSQSDRDYLDELYAPDQLRTNLLIERINGCH